MGDDGPYDARLCIVSSLDALFIKMYASISPEYSWTQLIDDTGGFIMQNIDNGAAITSPFQIQGGSPTATLILQADGDVQISDYPNSRDDTGTPTNMLSTDASGVIISNPISALPFTDVIEEDNGTVQSGNRTIDFQRYVDVATDGSTEVNVSLDMSEAQTDGATEDTEFVLIQDSDTTAGAQIQKVLMTNMPFVYSIEEDNGSASNAAMTIDFGRYFDKSFASNEADMTLDMSEAQTDGGVEGSEFFLIQDSDTTAGAQIQKVLISSFMSELISFYDGTVSQGEGNAIDVGEGIDINMVATEANINLDASEFQTDGATEGTEFALIYDADTTAGHRIQKTLISGLGGGDGIYGGSGTVPTTVVATLTNTINFSTSSEADLFIDGTDDMVGIGTDTPEEQFTISNEDGGITFPSLGFHTDQTGSSTATLSRTNHYYGASILAAQTVQKQTSTGNNDVIYDFDLNGINALQVNYVSGMDKDFARFKTFGGMQTRRVDSLSATTTLDESYYAVWAKSSPITISLPNGTTGEDSYGIQYMIFNDSGGNVTIDPGGATDLINGSASDITLADNAGYYLILMRTSATGVNHWMGIKTP